MYSVTQEAVKNTQYWRLRDSSGKPPGLLGWWPTRATVFIKNHDTDTRPRLARNPAQNLRQSPGKPRTTGDYSCCLVFCGRVIRRTLKPVPVFMYYLREGACA